MDRNGWRMEEGKESTALQNANMVSTWKGTACKWKPLRFPNLGTLASSAGQCRLTISSQINLHPLFEGLC